MTDSEVFKLWINILDDEFGINNVQVAAATNMNSYRIGNIKNGRAKNVKKTELINLAARFRKEIGDEKIKEAGIVLEDIQDTEVINEGDLAAQLHAEINRIRKESNEAVRRLIETNGKLTDQMIKAQEERDKALRMIDEMFKDEK